MNQAEIICTLLIAVAALAMLAKKVALPYPVLLVIGGLALGFVPGLPAVKLEPDMVFLFLLPPLLYPAALFTSWRDFRANLSRTARLKANEAALAYLRKSIASSRRTSWSDSALNTTTASGSWKYATVLAEIVLMG